MMDSYFYIFFHHGWIHGGTNRYSIAYDNYSQMGRHLEGANYAYHDGHVKWLPKAKHHGAISSDPGAGGLKANFPETYTLFDNWSQG